MVFDGVIESNMSWNETSLVFRCSTFPTNAPAVPRVYDDFAGVSCSRDCCRSSRRRTASRNWFIAFDRFALELDLAKEDAGTFVSIIALVARKTSTELHVRHQSFGSVLRACAADIFETEYCDPDEGVLTPTDVGSYSGVHVSLCHSVQRPGLDRRRAMRLSAPPTRASYAAPHRASSGKRQIRS